MGSPTEKAHEYHIMAPMYTYIHLALYLPGFGTKSVALGREISFIGSLTNVHRSTNLKPVGNGVFYKADITGSKNAGKQQ